MEMKDQIYMTSALDEYKVRFTCYQQLQIVNSMFLRTYNNLEKHHMALIYSSSIHGVRDYICLYVDVNQK